MNRLALELDNLLLIAEAIGRAALMRAKSRGSHFRSDLPALDDAGWPISITCRLVNSHPAVMRVSVVQQIVAKPDEVG